MALIDIGGDAIGRPVAAGALFTDLIMDNAADGDGTIDAIEVWAATNLTGFKVGTFFLISGTTYECRDLESIGNVTSGSKQTITPLTMDVTTNDLLAAYWATGTVERTQSGFAGLRWPGGQGDFITAALQSNFSSILSGDIMSVYGTGTTAGGWAGEYCGVAVAEFDGVTPAEIDGV